MICAKSRQKTVFFGTIRCRVPRFGGDAQFAQKVNKKQTLSVKTGKAKKKMTSKTESEEEFIVYPLGKSHFSHGGKPIELPEGWVAVESGDAALTRRIKAAGQYWIIRGAYKNKPANIGLCAPAATVGAIRARLASERATPEYEKKCAAGRDYRARKQAQYESDFEQAVIDFLRFAPRYAEIAKKFAHLVTAFSARVGSGTAARTQRIPIGQRAAAAVIAWMRHRSTDYDRRYIPRIKGERRAVRRSLAQASAELLEKYRRGDDIDLASCPLFCAINSPESGAGCGGDLAACRSDSDGRANDKET